MLVLARRLLGSGGGARADAEAAELLRRSAKQGLPAAARELGALCALGRGGVACGEGEAARARARALFELAAERGDARARQALAQMGEGEAARQAGRAG
jgi:TPR repeat protein